MNYQEFILKYILSEGGMKKIVITRLNNEADSESLLENYMINKILSYL
jgi:hypothetical protein